MEHIDTHNVELAFDDLIKELSKLKELNDLVDAYKDNIDTLSSNIKGLTSQLESFYISAKEHNDKVNLLYQKYVDEAARILAELEKRNLEFRHIERRNMVFRIITLILGILACAGLAFLIFLA